MIEGVIFDMDGVLLNSMAAWEHTGERYLSSLGIEPEADLSRILFPMSLEAGAGYLLKRYPLKDMDEAEIIEGLTKTIEHFYLYEAELKPGVADFVDKLQQLRIPMAVATSSQRQLAEAAFKRLGISHYFSFILTCSEVGAGKVKPDIYLEAARLLHTPPDKTWVFEDALHAIQTAKKAGFRLVGVYDDSGREYQKEIQSLCHIYMGNHMDFTYFYNRAAG